MKRDRTAAGARPWIADWSVTILLLLFGTTTLVQAFVIPTPSMDTSIQVGDHVLVDKVAYAPAPSSRLLRSVLPYQEIQRGDMIVFKYPLHEDTPYVKRVIGVPGDRIHFEDGTLWLNGRHTSEPYVKFEAARSFEYAREFPRTAPPIAIYPRGFEMLRRHVVDDELIVPPGQYFALGDNRDNSDDSRFWGLVPRENIYGKPVLVWWSYDAPQHHWQPRNASDVWEHWSDMAQHFFTKTRWERTFATLRPYPLN